MGLSTELLNADHHRVYEADVPRAGLRRHGDQIERLPDGTFRAHGRRDDTMKLGGIKVSSAEIERAVGQPLDLVAVPAEPGPGHVGLVHTAMVGVEQFRREPHRWRHQKRLAEVGGVAVVVEDHEVEAERRRGEGAGPRRLHDRAGDVAAGHLGAAAVFDDRLVAGPRHQPGHVVGVGTLAGRTEGPNPAPVAAVDGAARPPRRR